MEATTREQDAMSVAETITQKLTAALAPQSLRVIDESAQHAGHAGARDGGETHFRVEIVAEAFRAKSRVERQRAVYAILATELADRVHALSLVTKAPGEA
jgi:BolA protein